MRDTRTSSINLGALVLALVAFVGGFALAWVLRGQTIVVPQSADAPAQEQQATTSDQATQQDASRQEESSQEAESQPDESEVDESTAGHHAGSSITPTTAEEESQGGYGAIDENGSYTSKDEVALYIHTYGHLPPNYVSKTKARKAGWAANEGNLWDVLPGMSIGGGGFENIEGEVPVPYDPDRTWKECDINYAGGYRGPERIIYSDDGYILYTDDHYETFEQLFPREEG